MKNKITVTVGIPAHNESLSIAKTIRSILAQKQESYVLNKIVIVCDGCTDDTAQIAQRFSQKYPKVKVIDDGKRLGKALRLNKFFKNNNDDIFIAFDADIVFKDKLVVENLVCKFSGSMVGVVAGNDKPAIPYTFIEKISVAGIELWEIARKSIRNGDNPHNLHGCIVAFSRGLTKKLVIPGDITSDDVYIYERAKELGFSFGYSEDAIVYYRSTSSFKDYFKQGSRYLGSHEEISKYFINFDRDAYIPPSVRIKAVFKAISSRPIYTVLSILMQITLRIYTKLCYKLSTNGVWEASLSTKV